MSRKGHYVLTTLPLGTQTADGYTFDFVQMKSEGHAECYKSSIPQQLKFESLDSLMSLSDELVRIDTSVGGVVRRVYLTQFRWDEKKYPFTESAKVLTSRIYKDIQQIETRLREFLSRYQTTLRELAIENKKETGTLITRRLNNVVPDDIVLDTEYMQSVFVVITSQQHKEFKKSYESLCEYVVPESAIQVAAEDGYELYRVIVFKKLIDDFRNGCREHHFTLREYKKEENDVNESKATLEESIENQKNTLIRYCEANFLHVLHAWFHLKVIRLFTDSVLHYGLPTKYELVVMKMKKPEPKRLMKSLVGKRPVDGFEVNYLPSHEDLGYDVDGAESMFPFVFTSVDVSYLFNPDLLITR
ncbi:V-type proton ATPase subunit C [Entamoeba marina]